MELFSVERRRVFAFDAIVSFVSVFELGKMGNCIADCSSVTRSERIVFVTESTALSRLSGNEQNGLSKHMFVKHTAVRSFEMSFAGLAKIIFASRSMPGPPWLQTVASGVS